MVMMIMRLLPVYLQHLHFAARAITALHSDTHIYTYIYICKIHRYTYRYITKLHTQRIKKCNFVT